MSLRRNLYLDEDPRPAWARLADWLLGDGPLVGVTVAGALFFTVLVVVNAWRVIT